MVTATVVVTVMVVACAVSAIVWASVVRSAAVYLGHSVVAEDGAIVAIVSGNYASGIDGASA